MLYVHRLSHQRKSEIASLGLGIRASCMHVCITHVHMPCVTKLNAQLHVRFLNKAKPPTSIFKGINVFPPTLPPLPIVIGTFLLQTALKAAKHNH